MPNVIFRTLREVRQIYDFIDDIDAFGYLTEDGILPVEEPGIAVANEELARSRVRIVGTGHRKNAARVVDLVEFRLEAVRTVIASTVVRIIVVLGIGIATLDHKSG